MEFLPRPQGIPENLLGYNCVGAKGPGVRLSTSAQPDKLSRRDWAFTLFLTASVVAFWTPLSSLVRFSLSQDYASHIILIIPISAFLIYRQRSEIFSAVKTAALAGILLFFAGN